MPHGLVGDITGRSGIALAMRHELSGLTSNGLNGYGDARPIYAPKGHGTLHLLKIF